LRSEDVEVYRVYRFDRVGELANLLTTDQIRRGSRVFFALNIWINHKTRLLAGMCEEWRKVGS
jgi:hypothetical protein